MDKLTKLAIGALAGLAAMPALAQEAAPTAGVAEVMVKGDVAWMPTSALLVPFMVVPGVVPFHGGLVRSKNMLSVLMQTTAITALIMVIQVVYGYSMAFIVGRGSRWSISPSRIWSGMVPG